MVTGAAAALDSGTEYAFQAPNAVSRPAPARVARPAPRSMSCGALGSGCTGDAARDRSRTCVSPRPRQVSPHLRSVLVANFTILFESLLDNSFQVCRNLRIQARRGSRACHAGSNQKSRRRYLPRRVVLRSPSRTTKCRMKINPCAHRAACRAPARATCKRLCPASIPGS